VLRSSNFKIRAGISASMTFQGIVESGLHWGAGMRLGRASRDTLEAVARHAACSGREGHLAPSSVSASDITSQESRGQMPVLRWVSVFVCALPRQPKVELVGG
jgi:hypothetical protein